MKKHLIAAAVAAAVAVPAAAQVSVYGSIGYHSQTVDAATGDTTTQSTGTDYNLGTPVIGFRGSEDLGGGLKASFQLESQLNTNDGSLGSTTANQIFNRQSWVGVSGGFGALKFGRTATATKDIEGFGDVGANMFDVGGAVDTYSDRFGSTIHYTSPSFNGVTVSLSNTQGRDAAGTTTPEAGVEINAYNITYKAGPLTVAAGKADARTAAIPGIEVGNTLFGASYNAGFATFELAYQTEKMTDSTTDKLTQFGAIVPVGKGISIHANVSKLDLANETAGDIDYVGVMAVYSLSKRTRAFAGYRDDSYGTSTNDVSTTSIGLIHSF